MLDIKLDDSFHVSILDIDLAGGGDISLVDWLHINFETKLWVYKIGGPNAGIISIYGKENITLFKLTWM